MPISDQHQINRYYQALLERDSGFTGIFYVGVTTTRVFCIATCRARKPKPENVVFYTTVQEVLAHGFRPCKVCRPTENVSEPPLAVKEILGLLAGKPDRKLTDYQIRTLGYQPEELRRWFKKHHGLTFQAYQRMIRINTAFERLKQGRKVTASAFESGYESLSGFGSAFKSVLGVAPLDSGKQNVIYSHRLPTPLGPMMACATDQGLCLLEFADRRGLESELNEIIRLLKGNFITGRNAHLMVLEEQLAAYFSGTRRSFDIPLVTPGTAFQQKVWRQLMCIPYGQVSTYQEQALALHQPLAVRVMARANGQNRISIVIPCHRVVGSDGGLTGYGGGLPRKKWLLEHEQNR